MIDFFTDPHIWVAFLTLVVLEIILGIDNIIFLSLVSQKLPKAKQAKARFIGLALALIMRLVLLASISWIVKAEDPLFAIFDHTVSWRDIILAGGGLFLLYKGTTEIHHTIEGDAGNNMTKKAATFASVLVQIIILDLVFSLDSIITAVGLTDELPIMFAAVVVAIIVMMVASEPTSSFIEKHPSVKMLALSFLLLVGVALLADAMHFHIPRGYLYFAIAFSLGVETLNLLAAKRKSKKS